jgi:Raf kinase inhibitor-like YbhB/YbcL family protein
MWGHDMFKRLAPALLMTALASCGAGNSAANQANGGAPVANETLTKFNINSEDFQDGHAIPAVHSCDGSDQSPALSWDEPPAGTKSLALIVDDRDAPSGTFMHWAAYDIPPTTRSIQRGQSVGRQAINSFGKSGFGGPCPPKGHGPHHYRFKLYALDVTGVELPADAKAEQVEAQAKQHEIGMAQITGTYERK